MVRHRRNAPPGYTKAVLDEMDAKAAEFVALLKEHWVQFQKSGFQTIKVRLRRGVLVEPIGLPRRDADALHTI